ncbi:MAG: cellulase family glycosylhydrolase [Calditrichae bacterium]|nr:cellulase family glycosylhydrolase [Calditrichota bacterium]MCB9058307.1 cellulase family glycosylhydrolase [Calditrichia bacterium]
MKSVFTTFIIFILTSVLFADGYLKTENQIIVDGDGNSVILRGIGLGGWMLQEGYMMQTSSFANTQHQLKEKIAQVVGEANRDAFYDAWLENHITKQDVDSLAAWGFNSIRLPMHYNLFTLPIEDEPVAGQNTWLDKGFELTDNLLSWCAENKIYLILDLHAAPGGQGKDAAISDYDDSKPSLWESAANRAKTVALWRKLAERYANEPWIGGYDLINETNWDLPGNALLKSLYLDITNAIRQVDTNHIIFIEGNWFANDFTGLTPPWDNNMVYSFHKYWSNNDQGSIQWMLNIRNTYNVPIWCGESGENSNTWFNEAIKLFETFSIGWAWWPLKKIEATSNPFSIKKPSGYQSLLNYWNGQSSKPTEQVALAGLLQLAENANSANCIYQKDVVDAMIRQVTTFETKPYKYHPIPGIIYASEFDLGLNNYAYKDKVVANYQLSSGTYTAWNTGWAFRNDGVDIENCNDIKTNGYNVGWTDNGEWLLFTTDVTKSDSYQVSVRVASQDGGGAIRLSDNGTLLTDPVFIDPTGGWQTWKSVNLGNIQLSKGTHKLKLEILVAGFNINYLEFTALNTSIEDDDINPEQVQLFQNYPNPFNPSTNITYNLVNTENVEINVFNTKGEKLRTLVKQKQAPGFYKVDFDASGLASGIYLYSIKTANNTIGKKMVYLP